MGQLELSPECLKERPCRALAFSRYICTSDAQLACPTWWCNQPTLYYFSTLTQYTAPRLTPRHPVPLPAFSPGAVLTFLGQVPANSSGLQTEQMSHEQRSPPSAFSGGHNAGSLGRHAWTYLSMARGSWCIHSRYLVRLVSIFADTCSELETVSSSPSAFRSRGDSEGASV